MLPTGYFYKDPDTGFDYKEKYPDLSSLVEHVIKHREVNELTPLQDIRELVMDYMCRASQNKYFCCETPRKRNLQDYARGAAAAVAIVAGGAGSYVSKDEAERRASICAKCDYNEPLSGNIVDAFADSVMKNQTKDMTTSLDAVLFNCGVCSCPLKSKVWVSPELIVAHRAEKDIPFYPNGYYKMGKSGEAIVCWQKQLIEKDRLK